MPLSIIPPPEEQEEADDERNDHAAVNQSLIAIVPESSFCGIVGGLWGANACTDAHQVIDIVPVLSSLVSNL
jgi:hypothetical protein